MKNFSTKYLPLILLAANALGAAFLPAVQAFWAAHTGLAGALSTIALFMPQPHK